MSSIATNAVSGMNAAVRRLEVSASNVANVRTSGALPGADGTVLTGAPQAYEPLQVVQSDVAGGGTRTTVTTIKPSTVAAFDPTASFANQDGVVAAPNVDLSTELVNQLVAKYSFTANALVLKADGAMTRTLLDTVA